MSFESYMESQINDYKSVLSEDVISELKSLYDLKDGFAKAAEFCEKKMFSSNSIIDYSNDYYKNLENAQRYEAILKNKIDNIKENLGIITPKM